MNVIKDIQRRFWIQDKLIKIRCSEYTNNSKKPYADILIIPGLSEFIERYDIVAHKFVKRNFRVCIMDLPGQGLSTRFGNPKKVIHIDSFNVYWDAINLLIKSLKLGSVRPFYILGYSLGGFLALGCQIKNRLESNTGFLNPSLTICIAPMMGLPISPIISSITRLCNFLLKYLNLSNIGIPYSLASLVSMMGFAGKNIKVSVSKASQFWENKENIKYYGKEKSIESLSHFQHNNKLDTEGPSWNWVSNAILECELLLNSKELRKLPCSILMVLADNEYVTDPKVQKKAVNLFKNIEVLNLPSCRHDIFQEKDEVQQLFWKGIDQFIDKNKSKFETALS